MTDTGTPLLIDGGTDDGGLGDAGPAGNACGGSAVLAEPLGMPCGACDLGVWVCDGTDAVRCEGDTTGMNACGSCGTLAAEPGDECGACGGTYGCVSGGFVLCEDPDRNACGGCAALSGAPGDGCTGGVLVCDAGAVSCDTSGATNGCGGTGVLGRALGDACGACGDGRLECASAEELGCTGASAENGCGGCAPLVGTPGEACGAGLAWGCTADGGLECIVLDPDVVVSLRVAPSELVLTPIETGELIAQARLADGRLGDVSADATWAMNDESLATVDASGGVAAVAPGAAVATAGYAGLTATADVTVLGVTSLTVTPATATTPLGGAVVLTAEALFEDGSTADVTDLVSWTSDDTSVGTVDAAGVVSTLGEGAVVVTADLVGTTGTSTITVTARAVVSVAVAPASVSLPVGRGQALTATATFTDGSTADVTSTCTWSSDASGIASVGTTGMVTAVTVGSATVSCTLDGQAGGATITVAAAALDRVEVTPLTTTLFVGGGASLTATAYYSDGSSTDVTGAASWASSDGAVATVAAGSVSGVAAGGATISATFDGEVGAATVTVSAAAVTGLSVAPATSSIAKGLTVSLVATATFEDASTADVTASVTWTSLDGGVASVVRGTVTGESEGTVTIRASLSGFDGDASVTVTAAEVIAIDVTPSTLTLDSGEDGALTATATLTDGSTQDVSASASWGSSDEAVANVAGGAVSSVAEGVTTVSAMYMGSGATAEVTVLPPTLVSLTLEAPGPVALGLGGTLLIRVTGTFSDGSTADVTSMAVWSSSDGAAVAVDMGGTVTSVSPGTATVTATLGGLTASYSVTARQGQVRNWDRPTHVAVQAHQVRSWDRPTHVAVQAHQVRNWATDFQEIEQE